MKKPVLSLLTFQHIKLLLLIAGIFIFTNAKASEIDQKLQMQKDILQLLHHHTDKSEYIQKYYTNEILNFEEINKLSLDQILNDSIISKNYF